MTGLGTQAGEYVCVCVCVKHAPCLNARDFYRAKFPAGDVPTLRWFVIRCLRHEKMRITENRLITVKKENYAAIYYKYLHKRLVVEAII